MNDAIHALSSRIQWLEDEIESELKRRRQELSVDFENRKVRFEREIATAHRRLKQGLIAYFIEASILNILTAPLIYSAIVPMLFLDAFLSLYQAVCFPAYGIAKVNRADCFLFDRVHLAYLNIIEKGNCAFCSYANGLAAYFREIAGRTEQYWCPIKHARRVLQAHPYYQNYTDFGDAEAYAKELGCLRRDLLKAAKRQSPPK
jgi:hypothetical protein